MRQAGKFLSIKTRLKKPTEARLLQIIHGEGSWEYFGETFPKSYKCYDNGVVVILVEFVSQVVRALRGSEGHVVTRTVDVLNT